MGTAFLGNKNLPASRKARAVTLRSLLAVISVAAALLVAVAPAASAQQPTASVDVLDSGFNLPTTTIGQDGITTFAIDSADTESHTVTDSSGMGLFDSGQLSPGSSYPLTLGSAGSYPVVDTVTGNTATVVVPIQVYPDAGSVTTPFSVQWASVNPPPGYTYDVDVSRPGRPFGPWRTGVTSHSGTFVPDAGSGQYKFEARLRNTANGQSSGWSPWLSVTVTFASIPTPIGVVATPSQLLVTTPYCGSSHEVDSVDSRGNVTLFTALPPVAVGDCSEDYIDVSPGLGGFPPGYVYVTQGPQIYQISPDGSGLQLFTTIPKMASDGHDGITFDRVGSFGYDMIVTSRTGYVYKVNSAGNATLVGRVGSMIEGPAVVPDGFGSYGGDVLLSGEGRSEVWAMAPNGSVQPVAALHNAEHVNLVPATACTFGTTGGQYAVADYADNGVVLYNQGMLAGLAGDALATSEDRGGIDVLTPAGSGITQSVFEPGEYDPEGSSVVNCPVPGVGQAAGLAVTGPASVAGGNSATITVTAVDKYGQPAPGYTGTVHFTSTDPAATLPADYTFSPGDNGVHTFGVTMQTPGTQSITATDTQTPTITGSTSLGVAGPATGLAVTAATEAAPGVPFTVQVTARDANGLTAAGYAGTVHFTSSDKAATLPADYTFSPGDNGVHTFPVTLSTLGPQTLTVTDTAAPAIAGSASVKVPSSATHISVYGIRAATAGKQFTIRVVARDVHNNIAAGYTGTVHFTSTDPQASLPPDYPFQPSDAGQHVFAMTLRTAGLETVTVTDTSSGIAGTLNQPANPGATASLQIAGPEGASIGQPFDLTITAMDKFGNVESGYAGTIHFTSTDPAAVLPPDYTFTPADNGAAVFQITIGTAGGQTVTATDTVNSKITGNLSVTAS